MAILALATTIIGSGVLAFRHALPKPLEASFLAGLTLGASLCLVEFLLKPLFGRTGTYEYLTTGRYAFDCFHGKILFGAFPSGHSAQAASALTVLWLYYPHYKWLWALAFATLATTLILGQWHFGSDVLAGGYIGVAGSKIIVRTWRTAKIKFNLTRHPEPLENK